MLKIVSNDKRQKIRDEIKLCYLYATLPIVWPSKMSKLSQFEELITNNLFTPSQNLRVKVKLQELETSSFSLTQCKDCGELFNQSGVVQAVRQVQWGLLDTSTYARELLKTVSVIWHVWCGKRLATLYMFHSSLWP
jgi:hypothetical protein